MPWPDPNEELSAESTDQEPDYEAQQRRLDYNADQCRRLRLVPRESSMSPAEYDAFVAGGLRYGPPVLVHYPHQIDEDRWTPGQLRAGRFTTLTCSTYNNLDHIWRRNLFVSAWAFGQLRWINCFFKFIALHLSLCHFSSPLIINLCQHSLTFEKII